VDTSGAELERDAAKASQQRRRLDRGLCESVITR